jgi:ABC-2 type transport system ATP-binding protein
MGHGITAVTDLSLEINQGEVFGFLGPNGSGKTTTIGMILGLICPTSGTVELFGQDTRQNLSSLLKRVGAVVENSPFYPNFSARDNLEVFAFTIGNIQAGRIDEVLNMVGLAGRAGSKTRTFSLGMKQRLGIAIALLADPDLIVLDEPTNGLDPSGIIEIRELIRSLGQQGKTIFLSSHMLHEVEQVCDHVAVIRRGRVIAQGMTGELLKRGKTLQLRVSEPDRAVSLLSGLEWIKSAARGGDYLMVETPPEKAADVNDLLVGNGVRVSEMRPYESSLEEFFLDTVEAGTEKAEVQNA